MQDGGAVRKVRRAEGDGVDMKEIIISKIMRMEYQDICCSSQLTYNSHEDKIKYASKFLFHTSLCLNPFVVFDLQNEVYVSRIFVENRNETQLIAERSKYLQAQVSNDALSWRHLKVTYFESLSETDLDVEQRIRFIRFSLDGPGILHLKNIEVETVNEPDLVQYGCLFNGDYYLTHNWGFFSCCSTLMFDMARLHGKQNSISTKFSFRYSRDEELTCVLNEYFLPPDTQIKQIQSQVVSETLYHHSNYLALPLDEFKPYLQKYFRVNEKVERWKDLFVQKYAIDFDKTIVLSYRGTDKHIELELQPVEKYLLHARKLLHDNPGYRVWIQTDQQQVQDAVMSEFGPGKCFFLDELPATTGKHGVHEILETDKVEFSRKMLAAVQLMAACKHLITHTGNVAFWTVLYRGNVNNVIQI